MSFFAVLLALLLEQVKPLPRGNVVHDSLTGWIRATARNFDAGKDSHAWASSWDLSHVWSPEGRPFRKDKRFGRLAERIGMVDYWKQYGYPDGCRAGPTDVELICS